MTNLNKLFSFYDVHSHEAQENLKNLLFNHLPHDYTKHIIAKLKEENVTASSQTVRNVKSGITKDVIVFGAIVEFAKKSKEAKETIKDTLKKVV